MLCWTFEFSKINIVIYFFHHFPLTSHIRGHLLSAKMTLFHLSIDIQYIGIQKDKQDWSSQNTIDVNDWWYIISWPAQYIYFWISRLNTRVFALQPTCHTRVFALQPACTLNTWVSLKKGVCHTHLSYINTRMYLNLMLKNINHD